MPDLVDKFTQRFGRIPTETDPDYLEMLRMSKYRIMKVPDVQPGKCANCGASKADGRSYVDFGLDIPWHGCVFLCSLCIQDITRNVGGYDELEAEVEDQRNQIIDLKFSVLSKGAELRETLATVFKEVTTYFDELRARGYDIAPGVVTNVESYKQPDEQAAGQGDRPVNEAKQRTTKSTTSPRPKDLLSLAERLQSESSS